MSIYSEQLESISNRIHGKVGGVSNSRRQRPVVGSNYKIGGARSGKYELGFNSDYGRSAKRSLKASKRGSRRGR